VKTTIRVPLISMTCRPVAIGAAAAVGPSKQYSIAATEKYRVFIIV
jgi:hypothetical protein